MTTFVIEDEAHAEPQGEFRSRVEAIAELRRRADIPWDQQPNVAPCASWKTCGRRYELVEYDTTEVPWREVNRDLVMQIPAQGVSWASAVSE